MAKGGSFESVAAFARARYLKVGLDGPVMTVKLNHPPHNMLTAEMMGAFARLVDVARELIISALQSSLTTSSTTWISIPRSGA